MSTFWFSSMIFFKHSLLNQYMVMPMMNMLILHMGPASSQDAGQYWADISSFVNTALCH